MFLHTLSVPCFICLFIPPYPQLLSMGLNQNIQVVLPKASTLTISTTGASTLHLTAVDKGYMSLNSKCTVNLTIYSICIYMLSVQ